MQRLVGLVSVLLALAMAACSTTKPYERELLARPEMSVDPEPDRAALRHHMLGTREGAVGSLGGGGGGCGCN